MKKSNFSLGLVALWLVNFGMRAANMGSNPGTDHMSKGLDVLLLLLFAGLAVMNLAEAIDQRINEKANEKV